jgi:hypothetical protein
LRTALARISSAVLTQLNGVAPAFHLRVKRSIAAVRARTFSKKPCRMAWRVRILNYVSTWFIHDVEVGVKWKVKRRWRASQA